MPSIQKSFLVLTFTSLLFAMEDTESNFLPRQGHITPSIINTTIDWGDQIAQTITAYKDPQNTQSIAHACCLIPKENKDNSKIPLLGGISSPDNPNYNQKKTQTVVNLLFYILKEQGFTKIKIHKNMRSKLKELNIKGTFESSVSPDTVYMHLPDKPPKNRPETNTNREPDPRAKLARSRSYHNLMEALDLEQPKKLGT